MYRLVHIDDDKWLRLSWKNIAQSKAINLLSLEDEQGLENNYQFFTKNTEFYIDYKLASQNKSGLEIAQKIYNQGYRNIFISSGYPKSFFQMSPFIKDIVGKMFPTHLE